MEYQYKKALLKYNLKESDLNDDAKAGIAQLNSIARTMSANENSGKKLSTATINKIKALDKWIVYEIVDQVDDTENNDDEPEFTPEEIQAQIDADLAIKATENASKGIAIENELIQLQTSGANLKNIPLDSLKESCPTAYDVIFTTYDENGDNGIETSHFSLIETAEQIFTLTKK